MSRPNSSLHLVVAGGATGGHLFPGLAVAEQFVELVEDARVTFVGSESGIEARVIPETDFGLEFVDVQQLKGGNLFEQLNSVASLPASGLEAHQVLRSLDPDVVVSVGSYVAGPITLVASLMGTPTALMEQNSYPGLTHRLLSRVVDHAFLTFEQSADELGAVDKTITGNPVRSALLAEARDFDYAPPEPDGPFRILIIGGSGGAGSFNRDIPSWLSSMGESTQRLEVRHQAGQGRRNEATPGYQDFEGDVEVVEFIDDMAAAYRWCDLLICRAGASTISEVSTLGIPAIFVPFPNAADDHQRANARSIVEAGGGVMIDDDQLDSDRARNLLTGLMNNPRSLANIARGARSLARPEAGAEIAARLRDLARGSGGG